MHVQMMTFQTKSVSKLFVTKMTLKGPLQVPAPLVPFQLFLQRKPLPAICTLEWLFSCVSHFMPFQIDALIETFPTILAALTHMQNLQVSNFDRIGQVTLD